MVVIYYSLLLFAGLLTILRFRKMDTPGRLICALIWLGMLTEGAAWYTASLTASNVGVYQVNLVLELVLFALYFNYSIVSFQQRRLGYYIAALSILLAGLCWWYIDSPQAFSAFFQPFAYLSVFALALYSIFDRASRITTKPQLQKDFHFWVACVILLYECMGFLFWGIYNRADPVVIRWQEMLHIWLELTGIAVYLFLSALLILYPRLNRGLWFST